MGRDGYPWYRKSKRSWYVWHQGAQVRLSPSKEEAFLLWHELLLVRPAAEQTAPIITVRQAATAYLASPEAASLGEQTLAVRRRHLRRLVRDRGHLPAGPFGQDREAILAWLDRPEWNASTRALVAASVRAALYYGAQTTIPPLSLEPALSRGPSCLISEDVHDRLVAHARSGGTWAKNASKWACFADALVLLKETGARPSEICLARNGEYEPANGIIRLALHKTRKAARKDRLIVLSKLARTVCDRLHLADLQSRELPLIRQAPEAEPLSPYRLCKWMSSACKRLGISPGATPYGYRHTFATNLLARGIPDAIVAELLGHSSTAMLHRHYAHLGSRMDALRSALES